MLENTEVLLNEERFFKPSKDVLENTYIKDIDSEIKKGENIESYWSLQADNFNWDKKWTKVLDETKKPFYRWFIGGEINIASNSVDRWINTGKKDKIAIIYTNENGEERKTTYFDLFKDVNRFSNALKDLGVNKGDVVSVYLPMCTELFVVLLSCAKLGAIHNVIYSGLSANALSDRINFSRSKILITADGTIRRGKIIDLKKVANESILNCPSVEFLIVLNHTNNKTQKSSVKEFIFDEIIEGKSESFIPEKTNSEDPLFILYTSGSTGKPKGVIHSIGGYLVGVATTLKNVFDINDDDIYWCTADIGWITGHSYVLYAPLLLGSTSLIYEGAPDYPDSSVWWKIIDKYKVTKFYTSPTAIRHLMRFGESLPLKHNLSSLKILGTVGEPINPEAWMWYYKNVGRERCPIMDTWWQTETGMHMISPVPSSTLKPGSVARPLPGIDADVVDANGVSVGVGRGGFLVIKKPWPAMARTLYREDGEYEKIYWKRINGFYFSGDVARKDKDGYFWIQGRADDVLKIAGHRIGVSEIEAVFDSHQSVVETAVIGQRDDIKGEVIKAFVILKDGIMLSKDLIIDLKNHVRKISGPLAVVGDVVQVTTLPKTRSGKIMRRILRARDTGDEIYDVTTLDE